MEFILSIGRMGGIENKGIEIGPNVMRQLMAEF